MGFTLVELAVTILIISVLVAVASLMITSTSEQAKFDATTQTMQNIRTAIIGNREVVTGSQKSSYGYFGDVGALPTVNAGTNDLIIRPAAIPAWVYDPATNTGAGWNGPYLQSTFAAASPVQDGWGNNILVNNNAVGNDPAVVIRSAGPDGIAGNGDDIVLNILWSELMALGATNSATVNVSNGGVNISRAIVILNYPINGAVASAAVTGNNTSNSGLAGNYDFNGVNIPYGPRSVQVTLGSATYGPTPVILTGNGVVKVEMAGLLPQGWGGGLMQTGGNSSGWGTASIILSGLTTNANSSNITVARLVVSWSNPAGATIQATGTPTNTVFSGAGTITTANITGNNVATTINFPTPVTLAPNAGPATFTIHFSAPTPANAGLMDLYIQAFDSQGNNVGSFFVQ